MWCKLRNLTSNHINDYANNKINFIKGIDGSNKE